MKGQQFLLLYVFYASASTVLLYILLAGAGAEAIEVRPGGARGACLRHSSLQGGGSRGGGRPRHCVQVRHTRSCRRHRAFGARRHRRFHRYCRRRDCRRRLCHWGRRRLHRWGCLRRRWGRRWGRRRRRLHCCLRVGLLPAPPGGQARGRAKPRRWTRRRAPRHQDSRRLNTSSRTPSCRRAASRLARRSSAFAFRSFAFVRAFRSRCLGLSLPPEPPRMSFSFMPKLASISSSFSLASFLAFFFAKCFWT
mmetsp:Transcript_38883/g.63958  ORF Transcript_38883/g.63958 Transcript_38883/m.63958 type:complete len:251 (+) Transcript_38883:218-970(+)